MHPPLHVGADFPVSVLHGYAPAAARKALQFILEVCERLPGNGGPLEMKRETQEDAGLRASHFALVPIHLHLEVLFKGAGKALHHPFSGPPRFRQDD